MSWLSLGVTEMSRQFIYGQIARLGKANKAAQVAAQWDPRICHCGRKNVINMKCDYGCYYVAPSQDDDEAYYGVAFVLANLWSPSASF